MKLSRQRLEAVTVLGYRATRANMVPSATAWEQVTSLGNYQLHDITPAGIMVGRYGQQVFYSSDQGITWNPMLFATPSNTYFPITLVSVRVTGDGHVLVWPNDGTLWRSNSTTFPGTGFTQVFVSPNATYPPNAYGTFSYNNIFLYNEYGSPANHAYLSQDYGATFNLLFTLPLPAQTGDAYHIHNVAYDPYENIIWLVNGDTGNRMMWYSRDLGTSWTQIYAWGSVTWNAIQIICLPESILFAIDGSPWGYYALRRYQPYTGANLTFALNLGSGSSGGLPIPSRPYVVYGPNACAYFGFIYYNSGYGTLDHIRATRNGTTYFDLASPSTDPSGSTVYGFEDIVCANGYLYGWWHGSTDTTYVVRAALPTWVSAATPVVSPASLLAGQVGTAYSQVVAAWGGTSPYAFAVTAGSLPHNLSLNSSTGAITGTPDTAATSSFTITVTDANSVIGSHAYSVTIAPITISPSSWASVTANKAVSGLMVSATGGTAPYTYDVTSGALPTGLSLNSSTGAITGIPTAANTFTPTITVTDSLGYTGSQAYSWVAETYNGRVQRVGSTHLINHIPLSDASGATAVNVETANNGAWTYAGSPTLGQTGIGDGLTSVLLSGTGQYVTAQAATLTALNGAGVFDPAHGTLMCWGYITAAHFADANAYGLCSVGADASNRYMIYKSVAGVFTFYFSRGGTIVTRTISIPTDVFFCVGITWDGTVGRAYLNGTQQGADLTLSGTWAGSIVAGRTQVGALNYGSPWPGYAAHYVLLNTGLSVADMSTLRGSLVDPKVSNQNVVIKKIHNAITV